MVRARLRDKKLISVKGKFQIKDRLTHLSSTSLQKRRHGLKLILVVLVLMVKMLELKILQRKHKSIQLTERFSNISNKT